MCSACFGHRTKNNTTNMVIQQNSLKLLMMDILMSETCWAHKKWNKIASDIKLVFCSSIITMMRGPINITFCRVYDRKKECRWCKPLKSPAKDNSQDPRIFGASLYDVKYLAPCYTWWCSWSRHCEFDSLWVTGIFHWHNRSGRTQPSTTLKEH